MYLFVGGENMNKIYTQVVIMTVVLFIINILIIGGDITKIIVQTIITGLVYGLVSYFILRWNNRKKD